MLQKTTPKISIIIPCYNAAPWLHRCLDSVLAQTYDNWEALLINDGSTDTTAEILEDYAARDARFRVIHQQNKGLSGARNTGLRHMTGEWMTWLDADDAILPQHLATFEAATHDGSDFVVQKACIIREDGSDTVYSPFESDRHFLRKDYTELAKLIVFGHNNSLFRTSLIAHHHLRFNEEIVYAEDLLFHLEYFGLTQQVTTLSSVGYLYYILEDLSSVHKMLGSPTQELALYEQTRIALLNISPMLPQEVPVTLWFWLRILHVLYSRPLCTSRKERILMLQQIQLHEIEKHAKTFMQYAALKVLSWGCFSLFDIITPFLYEFKELYKRHGNSHQPLS